MVKHIILLLFIAASANAATIYCGPSGSGSGADFNNLAALPNNAGFTRGDTYVVIKGAYGSKTFDEPETGSTLITIRKASTADSAVAGYATSLFDTQATFDTFAFFSGYCTIDGVTGGGPGSWTNGHGIKIDNVQINPSYTSHNWNAGDGDNVTIRHCEIDGTGQSGTTAAISIDFASNLTVEYCYTHHNAECFVRSLNSNGGLVQYNFVGEFCTDCSPAIHGEIFSWKYNGSLTVRWNVFIWVESTGGIMIANTSADSVSVYGNVFYRPPAVTWTYGGDGVVGGWVGRTDLGVYNMRVVNNTFINIPDQALSPLGITPGNNRIVRNNYFYNSDTGLPSGSWDEDYNHYQDSGGESEANGTAGTGDPFTTLDWASTNFARLSSPPSAGVSTLAIEQTDMWGITSTNRGALQPAGSVPDTTLPQLIAAVITDATTLKLSFGETVNGSTSGAGGFTIALSGGAATLTYASGDGTLDRYYTISRSVGSTETGTLDYTPGDMEDAVGNALAAIDDFTLDNDSTEGAVATPSISLVSGDYFGAQSVTITCATVDADIYYTTDGSTPDAGDTEYSAPFNLASGCTLRAIGIKGGSTDSAVASATYQINAWTVGQPWTTFAVPTQPSTLTWRYRINMSSGTTLFVAGLHTAIVDGGTDLAGLFRFSGGVFECFNDDTWGADEVIAGSSGNFYSVVITLNDVANTYDCTVNGVTLANDYVLPASQTSSTGFDYVGLLSLDGVTDVTQMSFGDTSQTMRVTSFTVGAQFKK